MRRQVIGGSNPSDVALVAREPIRRILWQTVRKEPSTKDVLSSLESLFLQFNLRRLIFWLFILVLALVFESQTNLLFYQGLNQRVSLIRELNELRTAGVESDPKLAVSYRSAVDDLASKGTGATSFALPLPLNSQVSLELDGFWKFVSAGLLGILMVVYGISQKITDKNGWLSSIAVGVGVLAVLGLVGVLIPTVYTTWINVSVYVLLLALLIWWWTVSHPSRPPA
jgi:hypothetical protein